MRRKAGKLIFRELAMFFYGSFFLLYLVSPTLLLLPAGSHDSFFFRERRFLDGRGGRDGAARHMVF